MKKTPLFYLVYAIQFVGVFCAYYFAALWSLQVGAINTFAAPLWPPTGIALAALFFGGYRLWPAIALAAFAVNYVTGAPLLAALGIAAGNTLEALFGVYLLRSFRFQPLFGRLSDSFSLIMVALAVPFISAIIGPLSLVVSGAILRNQLLMTSLTWWIGDMLGALILAPFLLKWFGRPITAMRRTALQWLEIFLFFIVLILTTIFVFWEPIPILGDLSRPYLVFVPLTWGALRVGPRFMTAAIIAVTTIATIGTVMDLGPFAGNAAINDLFYLQLFLGTLAMIFLLFATTVEERKHATEALREEAYELREDVEEISAADRAKNEFIAILSHELRNPLAPIVSSLELLRLNIAHMPQFKDTIELMHDQVGRITRLLDDLLDITRISRKKFNLAISRVLLRDILEHSIATVAETMKKRQHTLTAHIPESPLWIDADPLRLEQVFVNLLNNAAKYTEPGGAILLTASQTSQGVEVRIRDNGLGIPREMLQVIFEPFRQAHLHLEGSAGLGIGLSLSKRFVELHGGTIEAKSDGPAKGSEFIVRLKAVTDMLLAKGGGTTVATPPTTPIHNWNLRKKKRAVLIVDDNKDAAEGIAQLLTHAGHDARTALDGASALATLAAFRPDIIFLDIGLPGESGYDLVRTIRQYLDPTPYLIALTGYGQEEDKEKALEAGFDEHLTKPVSIADLEKVLVKAGTM